MLTDIHHSLPGVLNTVPVLRTFSIYYTCRGIQSDAPSVDPGKGFCPVGVLALAATAVERGYHMHLTGDYISNGSDFSLSKWLKTTELYLDMIENDLTGDNWTVIFQALHCLQESDKQDGQVQVGALLTPKQHISLLPANPPTPPSLVSSLSADPPTPPLLASLPSVNPPTPPRLD